MASTIIMPKLGMAMSEGVIAKWNKRDGDPVQKDEVVAVVMSKKITYQLTAAEAGVLRIVHPEKATLPVGEVLGFVTAPGEALPEITAAAAAAANGAAAPSVAAPSAATPPKAAPSAAPGGFVPASPAARRLAKEQGVDLALVQGSGADGMVTEADVKRFLTAPPAPAAAAVLATSAARKLAQERGVDLAAVRGSGAGGRVTEQDVLSFGAAPAPASTSAPAPTGAKIIPFMGMREMIAANMVQSLQSMAQVSLMVELDATELVRLRGQLKADFELTYTDLLIRAVARTLKQHPLLNATLVGSEIHLLDAVHMGIAVSLDDGLIVPVLRDADRRTVPEIARETRRLAQAARDGTLGVDEATGSTFTITNLGAQGIDGFTPIINPPEVAILGVGRIVDKPMIYEDQIVRRSTMVLSLTIDHRIVDGAPGAAFLSALRAILESPYRLLV